MYNTKSREIIYEIIKEFKKPVSASEIAKVLKSKEINIHKTTIYRTLEKLLEMELINKVSSVSGVIFYELVNENHIHIECNSCNAVACVNDQEIEKKLYEIEALVKLKGFKINHDDFNFQGKCKACF